MPNALCNASPYPPSLVTCPMLCIMLEWGHTTSTPQGQVWRLPGREPAIPRHPSRSNMDTVDGLEIPPFFPLANNLSLRTNLFREGRAGKRQENERQKPPRKYALTQEARPIVSLVSEMALAGFQKKRKRKEDGVGKQLGGPPQGSNPPRGPENPD